MKRVYAIDPLLSWDRLESEQTRSLRITIVILVISLLFAIAMTLLPAPEIKREQAESLPPRLAKLITQKKARPKPPPKVEAKKEVKKEKKIEEKKVVKKIEKKVEKKLPEKKLEPKKSIKPEPIKPKTSIQDKKTKAKQVAQKHAAVFDSLASLRDLPTISTLKSKPATSAQSSGATAKKVERSLISGTGPSRTSGGVSVNRATSTPTSGNRAPQLESVATTAVESTLVDAAQVQKEQAKKSHNETNRRTSEQIQLVFGRYKSAINSIYRRALRQNPSLEGTVVLKLLIQADGSVARCEVVSSELDDPQLEDKIIKRVKLINFGGDNVEPWEDTYSISFFPS